MLALYTVLVLALVLFYVLYSDLLSLILLIIFIVVPFIQFGEILYLKRKIGCTSKTTSSYIQKGGHSDIELTLSNPTFIPISVVKLKVECKRFPIDNRKITVVTLPLPAKSTEKVTISVSSELCQRISCSVVSISVYDSLHLFSLKKKISSPIVSFVDFLPCGKNNISEKSNSSFSMIEAMGTSDNKKISTVTNTDFNELREYREGDRLNHIAWKLTGKNDEILVRDTNNSVPAILLIADTTSAENSIEKFDIIAENYYYSIKTFCEHQISFDIVDKENNFNTIISSTDTLYMQISDLFSNDDIIDNIIGNTQNKRYDIICVVTEKPNENKDRYDELKKKYSAMNMLFIYSVGKEEAE